MWRTLDHTADAALEVEAASWAELLAEATRAFGEWTSGGGVSGEQHRTERGLEVRGADRIEVWVRYWRELLRTWTVEGFLPIDARIETSADGLSVHAHVGCVSAGALDMGRCLDVKAVTWYAARVEEEGGRWSGTIVLDL